MISAASSTSPAVAAPNDVPLASALDTAVTTAGCACPRIIGPQEHTRSTYCLPSTSNRYGPRPSLDEPGRPAHRAERPDRGVDAARGYLKRAGEQFGGAVGHG